MKILEQKYPLGTLKGQKSAGRYIDGTLFENLKPIAQTIVNDMTFLASAFSSTLENGTGKSVLCQQIGEAYTSLVNEYHGLNLEFSMKNVVFRPKDLITRAFELPKYSCIVLDEWEDAHYWSELGMTLRQFFRKCRQLNLFILIIIPNFFQLPMNYAISRSLFAIDVQFKSEPNKPFARGYFEFYNFNKKKELYIKGKKFQDYGVVHSNFAGRFVDGYAVDEAEYRRVKYLDMLRDDLDEKKPSEKQIIQRTFRGVRANLPEVPIKTIAKGFGITERTAYRWLSNEEDTPEEEPSSDFDNMTPNTSILTKGVNSSSPPTQQEEVHD